MTPPDPLTQASRPQPLPRAHDARSILLMNDCGFQFGAGIATLRQAQSLMLLGHRVSLVMGDAVSETHSMREFPELADLPRPFGGFHTLPMLSADLATDPSVSATNAGLTRLSALLDDLQPDLVVAGTLHGARWPVDWLHHIRDRRIPLLVYLHDLHLLTGRCAHPGSCRFYGDAVCDAACPTADQYPAIMPPDRIPGIWQEKRALFARPGVRIGSNSGWTSAQARLRLGAQCPPVHDLRLGVDPAAMGPQLPSIARKVMGLADPSADGTPVILLTATSFNSAFKGRDQCEAIVHGLLALPQSPRLLIVGDYGPSGNGFTDLPNVTHKPFLHPKLMPLAYSAVDLAVFFSASETFGQTLMEAASCAVPIVGYPVGGTTETLWDDVTGLAVPPGDINALLDAAEKLCADPQLRRRLGQGGRHLIETSFTLEDQARRWHTVLADMFANQAG